MCIAKSAESQQVNRLLNFMMKTKQNKTANMIPLQPRVKIYYLFYLTWVHD